MQVYPTQSNEEQLLAQPETWRGLSPRLSPWGIFLITCGAKMLAVRDTHLGVLPGIFVLQSGAELLLRDTSLKFEDLRLSGGLIRLDGGRPAKIAGKITLVQDTITRIFIDMYRGLSLSRVSGVGTLEVTVDVGTKYKKAALQVEAAEDFRGDIVIATAALAKKQHKVARVSVSGLRGGSLRLPSEGVLVEVNVEDAAQGSEYSLQISESLEDDTHALRWQQGGFQLSEGRVELGNLYVGSEHKVRPGQYAVEELVAVPVLNLQNGSERTMDISAAFRACENTTIRISGAPERHAEADGPREDGLRQRTVAVPPSEDPFSLSAEMMNVSREALDVVSLVAEGHRKGKARPHPRRVQVQRDLGSVMLSVEGGDTSASGHSLVLEGSDVFAMSGHVRLGFGSKLDLNGTVNTFQGGMSFKTGYDTWAVPMKGVWMEANTNGFAEVPAILFDGQTPGFGKADIQSFLLNSENAVMAVSFGKESEDSEDAEAAPSVEDVTLASVDASTCQATGGDLRDEIASIVSELSSLNVSEAARERLLRTPQPTAMAEMSVLQVVAQRLQKKLEVFESELRSNGGLGNAPFGPDHRKYTYGKFHQHVKSLWYMHRVTDNMASYLLPLPEAIRAVRHRVLEALLRAMQKAAESIVAALESDPAALSGKYARRAPAETAQFSNFFAPALAAKCLFKDLADRRWEADLPMEEQQEAERRWEERFAEAESYLRFAVNWLAPLLELNIDQPGPGGPSAAPPPDLSAEEEAAICAVDDDSYEVLAGDDGTCDPTEGEVESDGSVSSSSENSDNVFTNLRLASPFNQQSFVWIVVVTLCEGIQWRQEALRSKIRANRGESCKGKADDESQMICPTAASAEHREDMESEFAAHLSTLQAFMVEAMRQFFLRAEVDSLGHTESSPQLWERIADGGDHNICAFWSYTPKDKGVQPKVLRRRGLWNECQKFEEPLVPGQRASRILYRGKKMFKNPEDLAHGKATIFGIHYVHAASLEWQRRNRIQSEWPYGLTSSETLTVANSLYFW